MGAYAGVAVLAGLLFYFFNPVGAGDCSFNISAITMTLVLALVVSAVSMLPYVRPRTRVAAGRARQGCSASCHALLLALAAELLLVGSGAAVGVAPFWSPYMRLAWRTELRHLCSVEHAVMCALGGVGSEGFAGLWCIRVVSF